MSTTYVYIPTLGFIASSIGRGKLGSSSKDSNKGGNRGKKDYYSGIGYIPN